MTLLQTILEVFHKSLIKIGREMSFKILIMCVGSYLTPNRTHIFSTICVHKKRFFCVKTNLSDKLLVLSNMEIAFAADNTAVKQNAAGPNIPLSI